MRTVTIIGSVLSVALSISASPAIASGKHIVCEMRGDISDGNGRHSQIRYVLRFYLDDTHSQLMGEGADGPQGSTNLNVKTESYSDTQVMGEISTELNDMWFGRVTEAAPGLMIQRQTGKVFVVTKLLPKGAEAATGDCHEVTSPPTKF